MNKKIFCSQLRIICTGALLLYQSSIPVFAQFTDDFSDGDFVINPTWKGDTADFKVNSENSLQLNAPEISSSSYLYTSSSAIENATWFFHISTDFNPSSANYADVYLVSDNVAADSSNGYFVRIGNTDDEVSLYRQDGGRSDKTEIIDGKDDVVDKSDVDIYVKVTRDKKGNWSLLTKPKDKEEFIPEGTAFDNTYLSSTYFGVYCNYTKTRADKFFFDDFSVTGNSKSDTIAASVDAVEVLDRFGLKIGFSEPIVMDPNNSSGYFLEQCNMQMPQEVELIEDSIAKIKFEEGFPENKNCTLILSNIADRANNELDTLVAFKYVPPYQPGPYELFITEFMPDPTPNQELPENEYFELYNPNSFKLDVIGLELKMSTKSKVLDRFTIDPGQYVIFCPTSAVGSFGSYGKTIGVSNWPTLLNKGDTLMLINRYQKQIFAIAYDKSWYKSLDKENGGWSLEMIDVHYPCSGKTNWMASPDKSGGSPGSLNAAATDNPDLKGPVVERALPIGKNTIELDFNESLIPGSAAKDNFSIDPKINIDSIDVVPPFYNALTVHLSDRLEKNQPYYIQLSNIKDCNNNVIGDKADNVQIVLTEKSDSIDVIFNELLFDPNPNGSDFIELFNKSDKYFDLKNWQIINNLDSASPDVETISKEHMILPPKTYMVLTSDVENIKMNYPDGNAERYVETNIPAMNNDEGRLLLYNADKTLIDKVYYNESYHLSVLDDTEGVSLERINSQGISNNKEIWQSAAEVAGFATPGLPNSQLTEFQNHSTTVKVNPGVFAPDNDGYKDFTTISYDFDTPNYVASLEIYDMEGRQIKNLAQNTTLSQEGFFKWDGTNETGEKVKVGYYIVVFEAVSPLGDQKVFKKKVAVAAKF